MKANAKQNVCISLIGCVFQLSVCRITNPRFIFHNFGIFSVSRYHPSLTEKSYMNYFNFFVHNEKKNVAFEFL